MGRNRIEHMFDTQAEEGAARGGPFRETSSASWRSALYGRLERTPRRELRDCRRWNHDLRAGTGIHSHTRRARRGRELAETREGDGIAALQRGRDRVEHRVDRDARITLGHAGTIGHSVHEILLGHWSPPDVGYESMEPREPNTPSDLAQPCRFAAVFRISWSSSARKSVRRRTPSRARASEPPSSRSTTQTAFRTTSPSSRRADTASASAPPEVTTSSRRHTSSPGSNGPSILFAVPYSLVSPRTMMKGRPDAIDAEAANATAPSAGPARRAAWGSCSATVSARRSPRARRISGSVSNRYLSKYHDERRPERSTKSPSSSARSTRSAPSSSRVTRVPRRRPHGGTQGTRLVSPQRGARDRSKLLERGRSRLEHDRRPIRVRNARSLLRARPADEPAPSPDREGDEDDEPNERPHSVSVSGAGAGARFFRFCSGSVIPARQVRRS